MRILTIKGIAHATIATALLALTTAPAFAQWTGKGEAGIAIASGNSDTKTGNAKIQIGKKVDAWDHTAGVAGNYVSDSAGTTARRFEVFGQSRFQFSPRVFWYGGGRYENDRFSGFTYQATVSTGVGRKFIDTDATTFSGQVGVGYKFYETRSALLSPGTSDSSAALVGGLDYSNKLTDTTTVFDKFSFEVASGNSFLQNEIGVAVKMSDRMALALAYAVRHNTDPPAGFKKTDTLTTVNLVYEIK
jgi:putative salt-induced outer membrane protein